MSGTAWDGFGWQDAEIPREPLDEATRVAQQLPSTLRPVPGEDVVQRPVFDPSLKHFQNAYRATDPRFSDPTRGASWRAARRRALHLVLDAIAASQWREALVLRGSVLMSLWFPDEAREPGDLDFVVVPHTWEIDEDRTHHMLHGIAAAAQTLAEERGSEVEIGVGRGDRGHLDLRPGTGQPHGAAVGCAGAARRPRPARLRVQRTPA
ncbi:nucleotidyl transferase AbiEii/AbiGii toxin family protein [Streptomyces sp. NPDC102256]|uniref:nucleotidyl transferase AbiEii/AbiGii toxin family protein n=1 Tax=Streptomyces sp. NPDC102256 TaxID=3366147 RepID=UPI003801D61F